MTTYRFHKNRPVREIARQARWQTGSDMVLDNANDGWLDSLGRVSDRHARGHFIGDVSHLNGAARISAALRVLAAYRETRIGGAL